MATVTVNTFSDDVNGDISSVAALLINDGGDGVSLREAVQATNRTPGEDRIDFAAELMGRTITLHGSELAIQDDLTIEGIGADRLTVDADRRSRVFVVDPGVRATIQELGITGGNGPVGGGILNFGTLNIVSVRVTGNTTSGPGGGIANARTLHIVDSDISGNSAALGGGGIANGSSLTAAVMTIDRSRIAENSAAVGAGLANFGSCYLGMAQTTVANNSASSAGGGLFNQGRLQIMSSTLSGNSAGTLGGGGANSGGEVWVTNSTITGNSAGGNGGGWYHSIGSVTAFDMTLTNTTIAGNRADSESTGNGAGGGIASVLIDVTLNNTIVAGNFRGSGGQADEIFGGADPSSAHNLIGDAGTSGGLQEGPNGNIVGVDPKFGPLQDNGGPTQTMALLFGSPAMDAAEDALAIDPAGDPLTLDQRGAGFPRKKGLRVDMGAYEASPAAPDAIPGDANRDGLFDSSDLVQVFQAGKYETGQTASWEEGDWNGDGVFDSTDLIAAFQAGRYEQPAAAARSSLFGYDALEVYYVGGRPRTLIDALDAVFATESEPGKARAFVA